MVSQHSDGGTNARPRPGAGFPARILALAAAAGLLAGLAGVGWPAGAAYGAVQQDEHAIPAGAATPRSAQPGMLSPIASPGEPALRIAPAGWDGPGPSWVFPFDPPDDPEEDGNQALAVSTTDGSVNYSAEFALVWAEDGDPVLTRNEAYAFASCTGCTAVAVGFQVVLIEEPTDVMAPQNLSAAVNYNCSECTSYALANQLVLSLPGPLNDDSMEQLSALWCEVAEYGRDLEDVPLSDVQNRLEAYKEQIIAIVQAGPGTTEDGIATSTEPGAEPAAEPAAEDAPVTDTDFQKT
jgi:putative peptide zinc metalloprotease protein